MPDCCRCSSIAAVRGRAIWACPSAARPTARRLALGNALVGNEPGAVALEVTLSGPVVEALEPTACVVFGAAFLSTINNHPIVPGTTFTLKSGDVLRVGGAASAHVVISALPADSPPRRCSAVDPRSNRSAPVTNSLVVRRGSRGAPCPMKLVRDPPPALFACASSTARSATGSSMGPSSRRNTRSCPRATAWGSDSRATPLTRKSGELISEAVAPGAVQVTNDGLPVVLGVDGQTIGGYPKVAHVIRADLDLLAQLRPGERVRFDRVSPEKAERAATERAEYLKEWLMRLRIADRQPEFV